MPGEKSLRRRLAIIGFCAFARVSPMLFGDRARSQTRLPMHQRARDSLFELSLAVLRVNILLIHFADASRFRPNVEMLHKFVEGTTVTLRFPYNLRMKAIANAA